MAHMIIKNGDLSPTQNAGCTKKNGDLTRKHFLDFTNKIDQPQASLRTQASFASTSIE
jgi:hypothetical protein